MKGRVKVFKPLEFRRSVTKDKISTPIAISMKTTPSILPPKKVIKALYSYDANGPKELSFTKGDFFHVIGDENDPDWYEACNPATNKQGLVPVSYFQVLEKGGKMSGDERVESLDPSSHHHSGGGTKPQPLYGIVLYDFNAERPDELDAKAGEPIIVIAQSNHEWFVAKPIGRLGGPGLIPVSFIEIRDHATGRAIENVQELMDKSVVPKVEEWKKMTQDYQESSIPLGHLDSKLAPIGIDSKLAPVNLGSNLGSSLSSSLGSNLGPKLAPISLDFDPKLAPMSFDFDQFSTNASSPANLNVDDNVNNNGNDDNNNGNYDNNYDNDDNNDDGNVDDYDNNGYYYGELLDNTPDISFMSPENPYSNGKEVRGNSTDMISASVITHYFSDDRYWFVVRIEMNTGRFRFLYRLYEDFYEFQIELLNKFPGEAGRTGKARILPFMPGPLSFVNESITAQRREDLDTYVKELLVMPEYILSNPLLNTLFELRKDDVETSNPNDQRLFRGGIVSDGSVLDSSPIDPTPPSYSSNVFQQPKKQPSLNSFKPNRGSLIKSSRVHDDTPVNLNDSSYTTSTKSSTQGSSHKLEGLRIKIEHRGDLFAILLSNEDMNFTKFQKKLYDRFGDLSNLKYKDSNGEFLRLRDEAAFNKALKFGTKLLLSLDQ